MNTRFLCTEVVGRKLTQLFIRTKNDIGSNGTFIVDTILSPALSDVYVSLMPRLLRYYNCVDIALVDPYFVTFTVLYGQIILLCSANRARGSITITKHNDSHFHVKHVSSSLGNRSIAGSYRYRSWQL